MNTGRARENENWSALSPAMVGVFALLLVAVVAYWVRLLRMNLHRELTFDDAYMFYRYALEFRHGFGFSWNPGGGHTYGPTSLLWMFLITGFSGFGVPAGKLLVGGSWLFGLASVFALGWAVAQGARSKYLSHAWVATAVVGCLLLRTFILYANSTNGMDTTLSVCMTTLACGLTLRWTKHASAGRGIAAGASGVMAFLARPDSALPLLLLYVLAAISLLDRNASRLRPTVILVATFLGGIAVELLVSRLYFGSALPLGFYVKSGGYDGYTDNWKPVLMALQFSKDTFVFFAAMVLFLRGCRMLKLAIVFLVPAVAGSFYSTFFVLQIMGFSARYYLPLLPFLVIPAMLAVDDALARRILPDMRPWLPRVAAFIFVALILLSARRLQGAYDQVFGTKLAYKAPERTITATRKLPNVPWFEAQKRLADEIIARAPAGVAVASSEVGYLSVRAPEAKVIDLSGLNDNYMARKGFSAAYVFSQKPDLIWFPVPLYTAEYGRLYSDPHLLEQYDVFDGALAYGIALRKDSVHRAQLEAGLKRVWMEWYPGYEMKDYQVRAVQWDGLRHNVRWDGTKYQYLN